MKRNRGDLASALEAVPGLENPPDDAEEQDQEYESHGKAYAHADVGYSVKAPAKAADQIDHGIDERDLLPDPRQDLDRIEAPAQKAQRRNDEERHDLKLLEALRPDTDDEAEQAEGRGGEQQERQH